jgi:hypothetical protein
MNGINSISRQQLYGMPRDSFIQQDLEHCLGRQMEGLDSIIQIGSRKG